MKIILISEICGNPIDGGWLGFIIVGVLDVVESNIVSVLVDSYDFETSSLDVVYFKLDVLNDVIGNVIVIGGVSVIKLDVLTTSSLVTLIVYDAVVAVVVAVSE